MTWAIFPGAPHLVSTENGRLMPLAGEAILKYTQDSNNDCGLLYPGPTDPGMGTQAPALLTIPASFKYLR